ncbi:unnamed protein product [Heligmosomoides polygyrus]|uniref:Uncharacterized protein n=1 Tax=Heligmosomoides polygyrus TaxID=6339 RepID=A0A183GKN0_HELPZ|nr:unnamed protein product [Heligmosomoides polygyrus]
MLQGMRPFEDCVAYLTRELSERSFDRLSATAAKPKFEPRLKRLRFADTEQKVDISRRDSISASELRRLARKQARKGVSKVLPIAEPLLRITAKLTTDTADDELPLTSRVGGNDTKDAISCQSTCSYVAKETNAKKMRFDRSSYVEGGTNLESSGAFLKIPLLVRVRCLKEGGSLCPLGDPGCGPTAAHLTKLATFLNSFPFSICALL